MSSDRGCAISSPCRKAGAWPKIEKYLPTYLQTTLLEPLNERHAEREFFGIIVVPDEANGIYTGEISLVTAPYVLQKGDDDLVRHDRLLFRAELFVGQMTTIKYKDAVGEVL